MQLNSIRFKSTILYSTILLLILIGYNIVLYYAIHHILIRSVDDKLAIKAESIANILHEYEKVDAMSSQPRAILEDLLHHESILPTRKIIIDDIWRANFETLKLKDDFINILNADGRSVLHSKNLTDKISQMISDKFPFSAREKYMGNADDDTYHLRVINYPYAYKGKLHLIIQVASPISSTYQFLTKLAFLILSSTCVVVILTSFLGAFFAKRVLKPVLSVSNAADNISHKDLSIRIPLIEQDKEMQHLIQSFNSMIDRLEKSFKHVNEFNAHVAHELKTPLAVVRGELELALDQFEDSKDKKILEDCLEEIDRMTRIVKDLLLIARLDYNPQILKFEKLNLNEFLLEIFEHSKILSSEKQIRVMYDLPQGQLFIHGDKVHLRRLFLNLVFNAIKFTPSGGIIRILIKNDERSVYVGIQDTGMGIAPEHLNRIFDKFFHIDTGEKTSETGSGLGLSIAQSIAKAHQGKISVKSILNKGSIFTVILPLYKKPTLRLAL